MQALIKQFSVIHRQTAINLEKVLKSLDIPYGQFMYILCICENEGLSQEKLSSELQIDKGSVARTIKGLEQQGFIVRTPSKTDRRQNQLFSTEKSRRVYPQIIDVLNRQEQKLTADFSHTERETLLNLLDKVMKNL